MKKVRLGNPFQVEGRSNQWYFQMGKTSSNRKEEFMTHFHKLAEEWLAHNYPQMIRCPYQPGKLIISSKACSKRFRFGRKRKFNNFFTDDIFYYQAKKGLSLCQQCPIGKKLANSHPMN